MARWCWSKEVDEPEVIGGKAIKVCIFLSIFDVHANGPRLGVPWSTSNTIPVSTSWRGMRSRRRSTSGRPSPSAPPGMVVWRQIAGAVARRIRWFVEEGQHVEHGQEARLHPVRLADRPVPALDRLRNSRPTGGPGGGPFHGGGEVEGGALTSGTWSEHLNTMRYALLLAGCPDGDLAVQAQFIALSDVQKVSAPTPTVDMTGEEIIPLPAADRSDGRRHRPPAVAGTWSSSVRSSV